MQAPACEANGPLDIERIPQTVRERWLLRPLEPLHAFRFHILAANGIVHSGTDIGTGIFARAAQGKLFALGVESLTNRLSIERHADFYLVLRAVHS